MTVTTPTGHHLVRTMMCGLLMFAVASHTSAQQIPRAKAESVGMSSERLARIEAVMQTYIDAGKTASSYTLKPKERWM